MSSLYKDGGLTAEQSAPRGITTTYRVVSSGSEESLRVPVNHQMSQPSELKQWLNRRHPVDVLRSVLMIAAVIAVGLAVIRFG